MKTIFWYSKVFTAIGLSDTGTCAYRSIGRLQAETQRKKKSAPRKEEKGEDLLIISAAGQNHLGIGNVEISINQLDFPVSQNDSI